MKLSRIKMCLFRFRLKIKYVMPSARLTLREEDVVRLALEFLHNRELHITQLSLERETGVINGCFSDDLLFLRQLILDGQWDDVLEFIQPLEALQTFDMRKFSYTILKHKYIELLCIRSEANIQGNTVDNAVEEVSRKYQRPTFYYAIWHFKLNLALKPEIAKV